MALVVDLGDASTSFEAVPLPALPSCSRRHPVPGAPRPPTGPGRPPKGAPVPAAASACRRSATWPWWTRGKVRIPARMPKPAPGPEQRDRNYRARIATHYDKSREASEKAKRLRERAASVGKGGVSSDDPEAVRKLKVKLAAREKRQDFMKRFNAAMRKRKKDGGAALKVIAEKFNLKPETVAQLLQPDSAGRPGFRFLPADPQQRADPPLEGAD